MRDELEKIAVAKIVDRYVQEVVENSDLEKVAYSAGGIEIGRGKRKTLHDMAASGDTRFKVKSLSSPKARFDAIAKKHRTQPARMAAREAEWAKARADLAKTKPPGGKGITSAPGAKVKPVTNAAGTGAAAVKPVAKPMGTAVKTPPAAPLKVTPKKPALVPPLSSRTGAKPALIPPTTSRTGVKPSLVPPKGTTTKVPGATSPPKVPGATAGAPGIKPPKPVVPPKPMGGGTPKPPTPTPPKATTAPKITPPKAGTGTTPPNATPPKVTPSTAGSPSAAKPMAVPKPVPVVPAAAPKVAPPKTDAVGAPTVTPKTPTVVPGGGGVTSATGFSGGRPAGPQIARMKTLAKGLSDQAKGLRVDKAHLGAHQKGLDREGVRSAMRSAKEAPVNQSPASPVHFSRSNLSPTTQKDRDDFEALQKRVSVDQKSAGSGLREAIGKEHDKHDKARQHKLDASLGKLPGATPVDVTPGQQDLFKAIAGSRRSYAPGSYAAKNMGKHSTGYNPEDPNAFRVLQGMNNIFGGEKGGLHNYLGEQGERDPSRYGKPRAWDGKKLSPEDVSGLVKLVSEGDGGNKTTQAIKKLYQSGNIDALKGMLTLPKAE